MMNKVAIVILNYINYSDTIECIDSIKKMRYDLAGVVVVDNCSPNESYSFLKKEYRNDEQIDVIRTKKNYGFAKGNNIGITYARKKFSTDFVYVANGDIVFLEEDYFDKLVDAYDEKTGIIGTQIYTKSWDLNVYKPYVTWPEVLNMYFRMWIVQKEKYIWLGVLPKLDESKKKNILHGCGMLFTPCFFKRYQGFYPRTFLYSEEPILYSMCLLAGIKQKYLVGAHIYHKEGQSTNTVFQNAKEVVRKHTFKSYKYVVWWSLKVHLMCKLGLIKDDEKYYIEQYVRQD